MFRADPLGAMFDEHVAMANQLKTIAEELGCSLPKVSIAWATANENMSTVMVGASHPSQLEENLKALEFVSTITPEVKAKIDAVVNFLPTLSKLEAWDDVHSRHL
ncbi:hypothetical protein BBJ28_00007644 [Nothophytophthora sp. Chile5]|nr:hypothetical protein BBJ28_00007644 [Nothophytophthora sp. Chile5]